MLRLGELLERMELPHANGGSGGGDYYTPPPRVLEPPPARIHQDPLPEQIYQRHEPPSRPIVEWEPPPNVQVSPHATNVSPRGRQAPYEHVQYDIGNPDYANVLRELFNLAGSANFKLASEIVPVVALNASEPGIEDATFYHTTRRAAGPAGVFTFVGLKNPSSSGVLLVIQRIKVQPSSFDTRLVKVLGDLNIGAGGDQTRAAETVFNWDSRRVIKSTAENGLAMSGVATGIGMLLTDNSMANAQELPREPNIVLVPGESLYVVHQNAAALEPVTFEGFERAL